MPTTSETYFESVWFEDKSGQGIWYDEIQKAGFLVPEFLWDAIIQARELVADETPFQQIAKDESLRSAFLAEVRRVGLVGHGATDEKILMATNAMPQRCAHCHLEDFAHCVDCGGCTMCCCSEYHCAECGLPMGFCRQCPQVFVDSEGNRLED